MYRNGEGVTQDAVEAARWYRLAAAQKHTKAQYNLGIMYEHGQGVTQDAVRAHMSFNLAAAGGHVDARGNRDTIAAKMSTQQLAEAQALARHCQDTTFTQLQKFTGCQ